MTSHIVAQPLQDNRLHEIRRNQAVSLLIIFPYNKVEVVFSKNVFPENHDQICWIRVSLQNLKLNLELSRNRYLQAWIL